MIVGHPLIGGWVETHSSPRADALANCLEPGSTILMLDFTLTRMEV